MSMALVGGIIVGCAVLVGASVFVGLRLGAIAASLRSRRGFAKAKAADEADASASVEF